MKYFIVSDIHGSIKYATQAVEQFNKFNCDKLICLGDVLYHGPRNDLPNEYNPKEVIKLLNNIKDKIICIKGNCDAEVDEMVLEFPLISEIKIENDGQIAHLTHGHKYSPINKLAAKKGEIVFYGHTHINKIEEIDGIYYINPGSITLPKENTANSFAIFEPKKVSIYDLNEKLINEIKL